MEISVSKKENLFGAILLVAGCCIGAGMIGLPVLSATAGFVPSGLAMVFSYVFTTITGLLLLEATLWFESQVNLFSIAQFALGRAGKFLAGGLFLFLFYCIFVAYMDGGGQLFAEVLSRVFGVPVSRELGILACAGLMGAITYAGTRIVDRVNRGLMLGLAASYICLVILGLPHGNSSNLAHFDWKASLATIPLLLVCFGYQNLVPSLVHYLNRNVKALRLSILIGNGLPLVCYFIWNFVILGLLPPGTSGSGEMVSQLLQNTTHVSSVVFFVKAFSLFALVTSFLAISVSFVDFLKDGLPRMHRLVHLSLVLVPPMVFSLFYPNIFLKALGLAGGFADVLLFGILPPVAVWVGRYIKKAQGPYQVPGGKWLLAGVFLLSLGFLAMR